MDYSIALGHWIFYTNEFITLYCQRSRLTLFMYFFEKSCTIIDPSLVGNILVGVNVDYCMEWLCDECLKQLLS